MTLIDDIGKKTGEGLKVLKDTAQDIAFNIEKQAAISKRKYLDITKLQRSIQKVYTEVGEYVYDQLTSGKSVSQEDPFVKDRVGSITKMRLTIADIEQEIVDLEAARPPQR